MKIEIYKNESRKEWHWRIVSASNGKIVASGEGYKRRPDLVRTLRNVLNSSAVMLTQLDRMSETPKAAKPKDTAPKLTRPNFGTIDSRWNGTTKRTHD